MDSHRSIEDLASSNANQPNQIGMSSSMTRVLYNAAVAGEINAFKNIEKPLYHLFTVTKNTVLHIYITAIDGESKMVFIKEILDECPSLLWQTNSKNETPLHLAARYGHIEIVSFLIECAKNLYQDPESGEAAREMLWITTQEKDTALHEALSNSHLEVATLLIKENPNYSYFANGAGETPLYIAVERNFRDLVLDILNKCQSPAYGGPLGRTALHAAVLRDETEIVSKLLEKFGVQITKADHNGWTPLHLAAYLGINCQSAKLLLEFDEQIAYMRDIEGRTALHIAAYWGHGDLMAGIISSCPDCCELVDKRGWNALHFAISGKYPSRTVPIIRDNSSLSNLLNEKDLDGNTALHLQSLFEDIEEDLMNHPKVNRMVYNKQNLNACDWVLASEKSQGKKMEYIKRVFGEKYDFSACSRVLMAWHEFERSVKREEEETCEMKRKEEEVKEKKKEKEKEEPEEVKKEEKNKKELLDKTAQTNLVLATLCTTVTFAAAITMPGGFVGGEGLHPGSAVLRHSAAFKAFIIFDTISFVLSSAAMVTHLVIPWLNDFETSFRYFYLAWLLIVSATSGMVLAFATGIYAVLAQSSSGLAIASCIICLTYFLIAGIMTLRCRKHVSFTGMFFKHLFARAGCKEFDIEAARTRLFGRQTFMMNDN
ncbi:hypothetical protein CJ030_MR1G022251 [Morella rubra]|uniref:PGG domain-containing protein n=1 Tax=Morella rubra TaxID=262757 RepID=A0A6A1WNT0_9ROSI|nr:hypothetical protein CJ030_MR1G022251 [Morella rubra]